MKLKSLNCDFLNDSDILKLNLSNIHSSEQLLAHADLDSLSRQTSIQLKTLKMLKKFIIGQYAPFPQLGNELLSKYVKNLFIIEFGCKKIDDLISNGIYSGEITEILGTYSSGKSQLCYILICNMLNKYPKYKCLYIDSSKNFCIKRVAQLLSTSDDEKRDQKLNSIKIVDCENIFHLIKILSEINKPSNQSHSKETSLNCNLLIIDSLSMLFNVFKSINSCEADFYLCEIINFLNYLSSYMNISVVVTNDVNTDNTGIHLNSAFWKSVPNLVLRLSKLQDSQSSFDRVFQVVKCNRPHLEDSNKKIAYFKITDSGVE